MTPTNPELLDAFPAQLRADAFAALSVFPMDVVSNGGSFSVRVAGDLVSIPYRIYHDVRSIDATRLTDFQKESVAGLLTRHHSGLIRQEYLSKIVRLNRTWTPPFVLQLVGEYVVEILQLIQANLRNLDTSVYGPFLRDNPEFLLLTERRVMSYWNCYYRSYKREAYVGFELIGFFKSLATGKN